jgi:hypothetical protein
MDSIQKYAKIAGFLYLAYILVEILTDAFVLSPLVEFGDAALTANNIMTHRFQFQLSFLGILLSGVLFLMAAWALYSLLKPVNKNLALLFLLLNMGGVAIQCVNDLNLMAAHLLLNSTQAAKAFQADQLQALIMVFLELNDKGTWASQIFFGAWLFPLGYLVFKSGFVPKVLGVVLMVHCFAWLATFLQFFLIPSFTAITYISYPLGFIAEFGFTLWLLIKGVKEPKPEMVVVA